MGSSYNEEDKLEFRQIVLSHLKRILEISSHELRDSTREITTSHSVNVIEQEDTRLAYVQAIENLAFVLKPYFDEKIQEVYDDCIEVTSAFPYEVKLILKEEYDKVLEDTGKDNLSKEFTAEMKVRYAKELFIELNMLLHRNDYLKSSIYGESKDETVEED